jgi:hypothetical protein
VCPFYNYEFALAKIGKKSNESADYFDGIIDEFKIIKFPDGNQQNYPNITGPINGKAGINYEFTINATDPEGDPRTVQASITPPPDSIASPTTVTLSGPDAGSKYSTTFTEFTGEGIWNVIYTSTDSKNNTAIAKQARVTVSGPLSYVAGTVTPLTVPRGATVKFTVTAFNGWTIPKNLTTATFITFSSGPYFYLAHLISPDHGSCQGQCPTQIRLLYCML